MSSTAFRTGDGYTFRDSASSFPDSCQYIDAATRKTRRPTDGHLEERGLGASIETNACQQAYWPDWHDFGPHKRGFPVHHKILLDTVNHIATPNARFLETSRLRSCLAVGFCMRTLRGIDDNHVFRFTGKQD